MIQLSFLNIFDSTDEQLKWDPAQHSGVEVMSLSADRVWKPDIVVTNMIEEEHEQVSLIDSARFTKFHKFLINFYRLLAN